MMQLYLQQPITYTSVVSERESCAQAFDTLLSLFESLPVGTDGYLLCEAIMTDDLCIVNCIERAHVSPGDTVEPQRTLAEGSYVFQQLPFPVLDGQLLTVHLNRFALSLSSSDSLKHTIYVRLYKERMFETAIQFLSPIPSTEG